MTKKIPQNQNSSKSTRDGRKRQTIYPLDTYIYDRSLSCLGTGTSTKSGGVKLV
jgi:hypothetical protein